MLSTERLVRSARFWSRCSLSLVIQRAKSTGMEVNRDFTSKETMTSSLEMGCCFICCVKTFYLLCTKQFWPLKTRIAEHKKAVASFDQNSKVASYVHQFSHNMNFANVKVTGVESNYHERLFHEALHSTVDPNAGNDHIVLPEAPGQKPTKTSRGHELHGHARKLRVTLL